MLLYNLRQVISEALKNQFRMIRNVFDYIFYRVAKFYFKWDGEDASTAIVAVTMVQVSLLMNLFILTTGFFFTKEEVEPYSKPIAYFWGTLVFILVFINYFIYKNKYEKLHLKWQDEPKKQRIIRGLFVLLSLILPLAILILAGIKW